MKSLKQGPHLHYWQIRSIAICAALRLNHMFDQSPSAVVGDVTQLCDTKVDPSTIAALSLELWNTNLHNRVSRHASAPQFQ